MGVATAIIIGGVFFFQLSEAADKEPIACAKTSLEPDASNAFNAFCRGCHNAQKLSASYFAETDAQLADRREAELAAFLDRHSACPHRHHEEIAAWLRQLSVGQ
jgi:nitrate/TMAO reductase-like tetraheme cytochrome c subunit